MKRNEFLKKMGMGLFIPFVDKANFVDGFDSFESTQNSTIMLITSEDPIHYHVLINAFDMTLETVIDEYIPYGPFWMAGGEPLRFQRTMTVTIPNYDKYQISVYRDVTTDGYRNRVWSKTYDYRFPEYVEIDLTM